MLFGVLYRHEPHRRAGYRFAYFNGSLSPADLLGCHVEVKLVIRKRRGFRDTLGVELYRAPAGLRSAE